MKLDPGTYTEAAVRSVKLPENIVATSTFQPLTHDQVLTLIDEGLNRAGLAAVRDERGDAIRKFTLAKDGAKMYGILPIDVDILSPTSVDSNDSIRLQLGIVNSFDRTLACRIGFGSVVSVCTNGCVFAEKVLGRKHTTNILSELPDLIDQTLGETEAYVKAQGRFFSRLREIELDNRDAHDMVIRMAREGAIKKGEILDIVEEYHDPRHEVFAQPTAWALHNAVTESAKRIQSRNGVEYAERSVRLTGIFAKEYASDLHLPISVSLN